MRAALAALLAFVLPLCATPLPGQERQPRTRPALPTPAVEQFARQAALAEPCIEYEPCFRNEGLSEGKRQILFTGGGAVLGALFGFAVCRGSGRERRQVEEAEKEGACSQSGASIVLGGAFVGALAGHVAFLLTKVNDAEPASPSIDLLIFRVPVG